MVAVAAGAPDLISQNWLKWAIDNLNYVQEDYAKYDDYYDGDHQLEFATAKWTDTFGTEFEEFADNWCQVVVDSAAQRLEIIGWDIDNDKDLGAHADDIWERNLGELVADDVHHQAFIKGDAYLIVQPDPENERKAQIFYNDALDVLVFYDPRNPRRIARAAKRFTDLTGQLHVYLYFPDHFEFWHVPDDATEDQVAAMTLGDLDEADARNLGFVREKPDQLNPWNKVPVFHFKNRGRGQDYGLSELKSVIPIQNAVNKLLMDMMVASEFGSFRMKWVAGGGQPREGWRVGGDRVWATSDPSAKFGEFGQVDLEPIFKAVEVVVMHLAKITQTPMHYLRTSGDMPSGEALKTAESGLIKKLKNRHKHWGAVWGEAMALCLQIEGETVPAETKVKALWLPPETRHDLEQAQTAQLKSILGIPLEHLWREHFGYSEELIAEFKKVNKALAAQVLATVINQISQMPPGTEEVTADPQVLISLINQAPKVGNGAEGTGLGVSEILALLPKSVTGQTTAGEATAKPQANTRPPASPTRRSTGFKD